MHCGTRRPGGEAVGISEKTTPVSFLKKTIPGWASPVRAINAFLHDINLDQGYLRDGHIPKEIIASNSTSLPEAVGVTWPRKTGRRARMYPVLKTGYTNDTGAQIFGQGQRQPASFSPGCLAIACRALGYARRLAIFWRIPP